MIGRKLFKISACYLCINVVCFCYTVIICKSLTEIYKNSRKHFGIIGCSVVIEVADQGCGVPESLRDKIFEQGVSTRADEPGEHGIGLYLIASYVTRCGGVITLEDNDPCGTLFSIYIPKVKPNDSSINPIDR